MNCSFCNLVLEEEQPKATLMCGHIIHTSCFIINVMRSNIERISCVECEERIVTPALYAIAYPQAQESCIKLELLNNTIVYLKILFFLIMLN